MFRRFSVNFAVFSMGLDGLTVACALLLSEKIRPMLSRFSFAEEVFAPIPFPLQVYIFFPLLWVLILLLLAVYDGRRNLRVVDEFGRLTWGVALASVTLAGVLYLTFRDVSRVQFGAFVLIAYVAMIAWRSLVRTFFRARRSVNLRRVLIVGAGPVGRRMQSQIVEFSYTGLTFAGFLDDDPVKLTESEGVILGPLGEARNIVRDRSIDDVVIALPARAYERTNQLAAELHDLPVKVWIIPDYFHLALHRASVEDFAGMPMLDLRAPALSDYQRMTKRVFDLLIAVPGLVIALPVMAIIVVAIWLDDGLPALFPQPRAGENGRPFMMLKFRTMVRSAESQRSQVEQLDDDGNVIHKQKNDPRITRVGRLLRRFSLDELPQIFNILIGNMSLVGPRPELLYLVEEYEPWQRKRFAVPQGLTGWWQIHGRSDRPMHLHTEDDLYYVQNYSIWLDIQILIKTFWIVMRGKGAY